MYRKPVNIDVYVIISMHDFDGTPSKEKIIEILKEQQDAGADIVKVAFMPNDIQDVLNLLDATATFTKLHATIPVVTVAMSHLGVISRLAGFLFGSAITFAAATHGGSAPGQVSVAQTRASLEALLSSFATPIIDKSCMEPDVLDTWIQPQRVKYSSR